MLARAVSRSMHAIVILTTALLFKALRHWD